MERLREISTNIDHRAGFIERRIWNEDRQAVIIVRERLESDAPTEPTATRAYRCWECKDQGLAQLGLEYTHGTRLIQTTTRAVCHCGAGRPFLGKYPTVRDLAGTWRMTETLARVTTPKPSSHATPSPSPASQVTTPSGGATTPKVPMTRTTRPDGSVVWEQNLDDFDF